MHLICDIPYKSPARVMLLIAAGFLMPICSNANDSEDEFYKGFYPDIAYEMSKLPTVEPILRLSETDFSDSGEYIGHTDLQNHCGDIEIKGGLGGVYFPSLISSSGSLSVAYGTDINVQGDLELAGHLLCGSSVVVLGDMKVENEVYVIEDLSVQGGSISCDNTISVEKGNLMCSGDLESRAVYARCNLTIGGNILYTGLDVRGALLVNGSIIDSTNIRAGGNVEVKGDISSKYRLECNEGGMNIAGNAIVLDNVVANDYISIGGALYTFGNVTARGGINVGGDVYSRQAVQCESGDLVVGGSLEAETEISSGGDILVGNELISGGDVSAGADEPNSATGQEAVIKCDVFNGGRIVRGSLHQSSIKDN